MTRPFNKNQRDRKVPGDPIRDQYPENDRIFVQSVRLLDEAGENLGVKSKREAMDLAASRSLDLVLISPTAQPPVAKICDYNKFIYEQKQNKKVQDRKLRESVTVTKEIQLRPVIGQHDLDVKLTHAREWLEDNCKIKIIVKFRGREMAHRDIGFNLIKGFLEKLENCKIEKHPEMNNNTIIAMVAPAQPAK